MVTGVSSYDLQDEREKKEKARVCVGHEELGARQLFGETSGGGNGNAPIPRLEGLGKRGGDCSVEQGKAVGTLDWKMVRQQRCYAVVKLAVAMASSMLPLGMRERARERK